ncbi:MAG: hypothetical protein U0905_07405 [Pirellulales bacterium]
MHIAVVSKGYQLAIMSVCDDEEQPAKRDFEPQKPGTSICIGGGLGTLTSGFPGDND